MRFGEALVQAGALNRDQLAKALEMQKILGGRLGSNLLELGMLDESTLLDHLGRFRATQTVRAEDLKRIPAPVLRSIPRKLALRYRLVPYQVRGKTLYVASKNPGDALQEDEISFLTSFIVRTHLALEFHLDVALHRHFKSPLDQRFVALTRRLAAGSAAASGPPPSSSASAGPGSGPGPGPGTASGASIPVGRASTPAPSIQAPPIQAPSIQAPLIQAPSSTPRPTPAAIGQTVKPVPGSPGSVKPVGPSAQFQNLSTPEPSMEFIELDADDLALLRGSESGVPMETPGAPMGGASDSPAPVALAVPVAPTFGPGIGELLPSDLPAEVTASASPQVDEVPAEDSDEALDSEEPFGLPVDADLEGQLIWASRELQAADIRDEIGDVLLEFASAHYRRRALVIRRKEELVGWMASGEGLGRQTESGSIRELGLAGNAPSVFFGLQEPGSFWLGPLPLLPANRQLVEALGGPAPRDCLVLPISLRSKIVGYLYVDNLDEGVAGTPVAEMKRLVAKAGLAFEVYILKNKIRMM